jgi:CubicO group peptidase (beta-lactamase class C family)
MTVFKGNGLEGLQSFLFQRMSASGIPGLSIAIVRDGELAYERGLGFRDIGLGLPSTPQTIYCIGSVTKSFTALAVMQLHEKGKLSIEDPVEEYISFKGRPFGEPILIKHLLSHTSGLPWLGYAETTLTQTTGMSSRWLPISSPQDLLIFMEGAEDWALSRPGQRHAYLNEGYILLGMIIEKASGTRYGDYVKEQILNPLCMERSTFYEEDVKKEVDVATPYITGRNGEKTPTKYPYGEMISDGGLMSSASDMVNFVKMMLSEGLFEDRRILSSESVRNMMEPKIQTVEEPIEGVGRRYYGYGLRIKTNFFGRDLIQHSGSVYGSSAYIGLIPREKLGVVVLANGGYFLEDVGEYALALVLGEDISETPASRRARLLDGLTGTYKTFRDNSSYRVTRSGGVLQIESSFGQATFTTPLIPVDLEGEIKRFRVYGADSTTPVEFVQQNGETFMIYERNKAKQTGGP